MIRYFSVDCEFTGLDHTRYDLASIGIVEVIKNGNMFEVDNERIFYLELKPLHNEFDPESMKINKLSFPNLYKFGSEPKEACRQILKYLDLHEGDIAVFIGYCNTLDKIYTDQLFLNAEVDNPFHYETIEISSLAMGILDLEWGFSESELEYKLNLKAMDSTAKHNALQDAIHQADEFCKLMNKKRF